MYKDFFHKKKYLDGKLKTCETRNVLPIQKIKMFLNFVTSILASMILGVTTFGICTEFSQQPINREEIASDAVHAPGFRELSQETGWKKSRRSLNIHRKTRTRESRNSEIRSKNASIGIEYLFT